MKEEKIEGLNIWLPQKAGDKLTGKITKIEKDNKFGLQAVVKQENGLEVLTPSHKWLQNCLVKLSVGDQVKIVFTGEQPQSVKGQSPLKKYGVFRLSD